MLTGVDPDHGLVTALRQREPTAAETLLTAYGDRAYRVALRITGNQHDAEEAVQDAFWSMVCKIDTFRGDAAFRSWFYRIVSNAAYEKIRRRRGPLVDISIEEVLPPFEGGCHAGLITDWSSRIEDPAVQSELRAVLSSAIAALPAHYRTVIVLRDVEGLSMAEVAEVLGISVPTAKTWAHRARLLLRKRLSMFMTSVGGPSTGRLEGNTSGGRCAEADVNTKSRRSPEVLAAGAGMQPARAVGRRKVTRLWRRKLGPNWNGLKSSSSAVERPASCWPGISRDRQ